MSAEQDPHTSLPIPHDIARNIVSPSRFIRNFALATILSLTISPAEAGVAVSDPLQTPELAAAATSATSSPTPLESPAPAQSKHCTTLRRRPEEIMFGTACEDNAKAATVGSGFRDRGWVYSTVSVNGIYKCAYIRDDVLPKFKPRRHAISRCLSYYRPLTHKRHFILKRINCPELLPGVEGCKDGAEEAPPTPDCENPELFGNYASDNPSPLNEFGTGKGGFSDSLGDVDKTGIHFRAEVKPTSPAGRADVARSHEWGLVLSGCVNRAHMAGGPVSDLTPVQKKKVMADPAKREVLSDLQNQ